MLLGARASCGSIRAASFSWARRRALARRLRRQIQRAVRMRQSPRNEKIGMIIRSVWFRVLEDEVGLVVVELAFACRSSKGYL